MGWFSDIAKEYPEFLIETERLALLDAENIKRNKENSRRLIKSDLEPKLPRLIKFKEVLWALRDGKIDTTAYCPSCELAIETLPSSSNEKLACSTCNFVAPFRPGDIEKLVRSLESRIASL